MSERDGFAEPWDDGHIDRAPYIVRCADCQAVTDAGKPTTCPACPGREREEAPPGIARDQWSLPSMSAPSYIATNVDAPEAEKDAFFAALAEMDEPGDRDRERAVLAQMHDTLRTVLGVVSLDEPYPWECGALKHQIREDLTAYDALGLDLSPSEEPLMSIPEELAQVRAERDVAMSDRRVFFWIALVETVVLIVGTIA